jgi:uncharacterized RDD family membrane protein YckC
MDQEIYPGVFVRVKSIVLDAIVLLIFMGLTTYLFSLFVSVPDFARITAFIFIFLLYDPIFTSSFGGTFGHMMVGVRVRRASDVSKNILIHKALLRSLVKGTLGEISLFTIAFNDKNKAIHDYVADSVVVYVDGWRL